MKARGRRWDTQRESMRRGEERRGWAVSPESYTTPNNYNCRFTYLRILLLSLEGEKTSPVKIWQIQLFFLEDPTCKFSCNKFSIFWADILFQCSCPRWFSHWNPYSISARRTTDEKDCTVWSESSLYSGVWKTVQTNLQHSTRPSRCRACQVSKSRQKCTQQVSSRSVFFWCFSTL